MAKDYVTGKKTTFGNKRSHSLNSTVTNVHTH